MPVRKHDLFSGFFPRLSNINARIGGVGTTKRCPGRWKRTGASSAYSNTGKSYGETT
jgi:hypothetical protein